VDLYLNEVKEGYDSLSPLLNVTSLSGDHFTHNTISSSLTNANKFYPRLFNITLGMISMYLVLITFDEMISRVERDSVEVRDVIFYFMEIVGCMLLSNIACCKGGESYRLTKYRDNGKYYGCIDNTHSVSAGLATVFFLSSNVYYLVNKYDRSNITCIGFIVGLIAVICLLGFFAMNSILELSMTQKCCSFGGKDKTCLCFNCKGLCFDSSQKYKVCGKNISLKRDRCCCYIFTYTLEAIFLYFLILSYAIFSFLRNDHYPFIDHTGNDTGFCSFKQLFNKTI
jgi:hypothetical protein